MAILEAAYTVGRAGPGPEPFAGRTVSEALRAERKPPLDGAQAMAESMRCLLCGGPYAAAPCVTACPAGVDVPAMIDAIGRGERERAARIVLEENPLGGTCARVCPTEVLCEGACVLVHDGQPAVDIAGLERFAMDSLGPEGGGTILPPVLGRGRAGDGASGGGGAGRATVSVIGAGPAGLTCASVLAERGFAVTVYDDRAEAGGLVRYAVAPYRQLDEPLPAERRRIEELGVRFVPVAGAEALGVLAEADRADAVFLGVGMGDDRRLGLEGEDLQGVFTSLPFIAALKSGRPPAVGARVVVVGGGNTAMDVAREAVRLGAHEVTVLYRRTEVEMPAYHHEYLEARADGVNFLWLTTPVRLVGKAGRLVGVECRYMRLGEVDASGRRRAEAVPGTEFQLAVDTLVEAIGQEPRRAFLAGIPGLEVADGRIVVDPASGQTGNPRYFAGGDAVNGGDTVVAAVRGAKVAAAGIERFLSEARRPLGPHA